MKAFLRRCMKKTIFTPSLHINISKPGAMISSLGSNRMVVASLQDWLSRDKCLFSLSCYLSTTLKRKPDWCHTRNKIVLVKENETWARTVHRVVKEGNSFRIFRMCMETDFFIEITSKYCDHKWRKSGPKHPFVRHFNRLQPKHFSPIRTGKKNRDLVSFGVSTWHQ